MRGSTCPEAWACRLLEKLPMPERVGSKVLPIPIKTRLFLRGRPEAMGEQQEPSRIYAGEVSVFEREMIFQEIQHYGVELLWPLHAYHMRCIFNNLQLSEREMFRKLLCQSNLAG